MRITAYGATDVGRHREGNEDNMFSGATVFAVADGMGGHQAGEVASETALRPVAELDGAAYDDPKAATEALADAIRSANDNVVSQAQSDPNLAGMGTTLTAVMVRDGSMHLAHVGDSRAYLLRQGEQINQLTTDHTLVEQLVQDGRLSRDEIGNHPQRSVITRAIGVERTVDVDTLAPLVLQAGDQVLLCSDGLTGPVSDAEVATILAEESDGDAAVQRLIDAANEAGGPDNITVVLLRVDGDDDAAAAPAGAAMVDDDATQAVTTGPIDSPPPRSIPIRTRPESGNHNWAKDMSRYGDRQGVDSGTGMESSGRGKRVLAILTGVLVILGILAAGAYLVLSRAYFIGDSEGTIAVYQGLPFEVAGITLNREVFDSEMPIADLPQLTQQRIRAGEATVRTLQEGKDTIEGYQADADQAEADQEPTPRKTKSSSP